MRKYLMIVFLAASIGWFTAGPAHASCTTHTIMGPNGSLTFCTTCCTGTNCFTNCF